MIELLNWPMLAVTVTVLALLWFANDLGYRIGRVTGKDEPEASRNVANAIKVSVIGLVAFLLGFAFSISSGRHDVRRQVVLDEANAAGTLHLRAGLLPAAERDRLRATLTRYLTLRIEVFDQNLSDEFGSPQKKEMDSLLADVWTTVELAKGKDAQAVLVSQIIPAANALIDLNTTRGWAFRSHTPPAVLAVLMVCVLVSAGLMGHSFGQCQRRHGLLCFSFNLLFTLTLYLILDYDGPRYGLLRVDHAVLRDCLDGLRAT